MSETITSLQGGLAGESQAHIKYRYFARIARAEGYDEVARHFEKIADEKLLNAWGHLDILMKKPSTNQCLEMAIEGETYEYEIMYPEFKEIAEFEANLGSVQDSNEEANTRANEFKQILKKAEEHFDALVKASQQRAEDFQLKLDELNQVKVR